MQIQKANNDSLIAAARNNILGAAQLFEQGRDRARAEATIRLRQLALFEMLNGIADLILLSSAIPRASRGNALKAMFIAREGTIQKDEQLAGACYGLDGAVKDFRAIYHCDPPEIDLQRISRAILIANDFAGALRRLVAADDPSADELQQLFEQHGIEIAQEVAADIQAAAPKLGRKAGPEALTKHILVETRNIRKAHHTHSPGDDVDMWMKQLCRREDVKAWEQKQENLKGDARQNALDKESLDVQAYDMFRSPMSTLQRGTKLKWMRDKYRDY